MSTRAGTLTIGGNVSVDYQHVGVPFESSNDYAMSLSFAPSFGVFVFDGLEVGLGLDVAVLLTGDVPKHNTYVIRGLARYYLGSWLLAPFVGVGFGPHIVHQQATRSPFIYDGTRFELSFELGVAIPLRRWVALTFALRPELLFPVSDWVHGTLLTFRVAAFGVRAFF